MAAPLHSAKQPVKLAGQGVRVSKIRRDPPPVAKKTVIPDRDHLDRRNVPVGILVFALALVVAIIGLASFAWSPREVTLHVDDRGGY